MRTTTLRAACLAALATGTSAFAGTVTPELKAAFRSRDEAKVLVYFKDETPRAMSRDASPEATITRLQANLASSLRILSDELGFSSPDAIRSANWITNSVSMTLDADAVEAISAHPAVDRVLWDAPVSVPQVARETTDKPLAGPYTYGLEKLGVPQVREVFGITGKGVLVGNIDTGADGNHPDIQGRIAGYKDFSGETSAPTDTDGHGTHTVGTMVGGASTGTSIGVAPDAKILVARAIAGSSTITNLLNAMQWMIDPDGNPSTNDAPRVVSMSWHSGGGDQQPFYNAIQAMADAGVIPNFSAGNSGSSGLTHPKEHPETVTNGATDSADEIADFSSRGPAFYQGAEQKKPEWSAPGVDVHSAKPGGGYQTMSGTSMAAPHGAGVIALLFEADPTLSPAQVRQILIDTADDKGPAGWDGAFGHGRLNAFKAVSLVAKGGKVHGKITNASGAAIPGARLTVVERDFSVPAKEDGSYSLRLPEGTYTLKASAFAYVTRTETVNVAIDGDVTVDLALEAAETVEATGKVVAKADGTPVSAKVKVGGTPLPVQQTGADGSFSFSLPAGEYAFTVSAFGFKVVCKNVVVPGGDLQFALDPLPPILVVDDDAGKGYETFYQTALVALGKEFGVLARGSELDETTLLPYKTVIWLTGDDYQDTLSGNDQTRIQEYLAQGGKLVISSQELGYHLKNSAFYKDVVKAEFKKDNSGSKEISGQGLSFSIDGGDGAGNQKYPDSIAARAGAEQVFQYGNGEGAGLRVGNSLVYLSFGIEGISTAANRAAVLGKALSLLEGAVGEDTATEPARAISREARFGELHR